MAKEVHIKITDEQHKFMEDFRKEFGVTMQVFILNAIAEKISKLKQAK